MARGAQCLQVLASAIGGFVVLMAYRQGALSCIEFLTRPAALLAASLALPIRLVFDLARYLVPVFRV